MLTGNTPEQPARLYTEPPITAFGNATRQFDRGGAGARTDRQPDRHRQAAPAHRAGQPARQDGRRADPHLPGVPRAAQQGPRPGQGRHPLPPRREPGRDLRPRLLDDRQVRGRRHSHGRRQGGHRGRSLHPLRHGAGTALAPLRRRADRVLRAGRRRARPRRRHERPDDGLDDGHLHHAHPPLHPGRHHRQAAGDRRLGRTRSGHGARAALQRPALGPAHRAQPAGHDRGGPGVRQRRLLVRAAAGRGRLPRRRHLGCQRRLLTTPTGSTSRRPSRTRGRTGASSRATRRTRA